MIERIIVNTELLVAILNVLSAILIAIITFSIYHIKSKRIAKQLKFKVKRRKKYHIRQSI